MSQCLSGRRVHISILAMLSLVIKSTKVNDYGLQIIIQKYTHYHFPIIRIGILDLGFVLLLDFSLISVLLSFVINCLAPKKVFDEGSS